MHQALPTLGKRNCFPRSDKGDADVRLDNCQQFGGHDRRGQRIWTRCFDLALCAHPGRLGNLGRSSEADFGSRHAYDRYLPKAATWARGYPLRPWQSRPASIPSHGSSAKASPRGSAPSRANSKPARPGWRKPLPPRSQRPGARSALIAQARRRPPAWCQRQPLVCPFPFASKGSAAPT